MQTTKVHLDAKGRLVIPASFRRALGMAAGDELVLWVEDDELQISTMRRRIARAQQLVRKHVRPGTSLVDELICERRKLIR